VFYNHPIHFSICKSCVGTSDYDCLECWTENYPAKRVGCWEGERYKLLDAIRGVYLKFSDSQGRK